MDKKKIIDLSLNILTAVIVIIVLAIAISSIVNANVGYNEIFGVAGVSVQSDSMKGDKKDNFSKGDLIYMKLLKTEEARLENIKEGDIITFFDVIDNKRVLITHRVKEITDTADGVVYVTHGDNNPADVYEYINIKAVVGKFNGTILKGMGKVTDFFNGQVGFGIFVVAPSILLVIYAGYKVFQSLRNLHKEDVAVAAEGAKESLSDEEIERLYNERLAKRNAENSDDDKDDGRADN